MRSFVFPQMSILDIQGEYIDLPKIGQVKMVLSRDTCKNLQDSLETVNIFTFQRLQGPSLLTETELNRIKF